MKQSVAEAYGTFFLVFAVGAAGAQFGHSAAVSVAAAFALIAGGYAFGHVSGGHFNPIVTLAFQLAGRFKGDLLSYWAGQLAGAIVAAVVLRLTMPTGASEAVAIGGGFWDELFGSALFLLLAIGATAQAAREDFAPFAVGLAFGAMALAVGPGAGGALNPALATALVLGPGPDGPALWVGWLAPLIAVPVAVALWRVVRPS
ncbi:MAG: aquaporin [Pseudomonadota bacterium]